MSCVILCKHKDFPWESNSFSNSSLFKYAKKDVLLWVTDTGKSTEQNTQRNWAERGLSPVTLRLWRAAEWQSWPQCPWTVLCPLPDHHHHTPARPYAHGLSKCWGKEIQHDISPKLETYFTEPQFKRKNSTLTYLTSTHETEARPFQIPSVLTVCLCKDQMPWGSGLIGPFEKEFSWVLIVNALWVTKWLGKSLSVHTGSSASSEHRLCLTKPNEVSLHCLIDALT